MKNFMAGPSFLELLHPHVWIYSHVSNFISHFLCIQLDQTLQEHFPIYKSFRFKGSIGPVRVHLTSPKSFLKLTELVANLSGVPLDCVQVTRTLKYQELAECMWKQVFS